MGSLDPTALLGVELPPVPMPVRARQAPRAGLASWWRAGEAAVAAGAGTVWFTGTPGGTCDPCTLAAAGVARLGVAQARAAPGTTAPPHTLLGVVSPVPAGRHPAVLARDVTALDVLSGGRAAVGLQCSPRDGGGAREAAWRHLAEALAVVRAVAVDDDPVFDGRFLHVAGAVNLPRPSRPGGPPIFVEPPPGAAGAARRDEDAAFLVRQLVAAGATVVCGTEVEEVSAWRRVLDDAAGARAGAAAAAAPSHVVCRAELGAGPRQRARRARAARGADPQPRDRHPHDPQPHGPQPPDPQPAATLVEALAQARDAGAAGVIACVRSPRGAPAAAGPGTGTADGHLAEELARLFSPWTSGGGSTRRP